MRNFIKLNIYEYLLLIHKQKILAAILLAIRANTEEIKPMIDDLKTSFFGMLPCHICQTLDVRIFYFLKLDKNSLIYFPCVRYD